MDPQHVVLLVFVAGILGGGTLAALAYSPVGQALAARLRRSAEGEAAAGDSGEVLAAVDALRREVAELAERVDFTERLLAQPRDQGRLAPPPSGGVAH